MASGSSPSSSTSSHGPLGPVFRIVPGVQSYDWGILGKDGSAVSKYAFGGAGSGEKLGLQYDENKPYAEVSTRALRPAMPSNA